MHNIMCKKGFCISLSIYILMFVGAFWCFVICKWKQCFIRFDLFFVGVVVRYLLDDESTETTHTQTPISTWKLTTIFSLAINHHERNSAREIKNDGNVWKNTQIRRRKVTRSQRRKPHCIYTSWNSSLKIFTQWLDIWSAIKAANTCAQTNSSIPSTSSSSSIFPDSRFNFTTNKQPKFCFWFTIRCKNSCAKISNVLGQSGNSFFSSCRSLLLNECQYRFGDCFFFQMCVCVNEWVSVGHHKANHVTLFYISIEIRIVTHYSTYDVCIYVRFS